MPEIRFYFNHLYRDCFYASEIEHAANQIHLSQVL